jgi:hypothetical protein
MKLSYSSIISTVTSKNLRLQYTTIPSGGYYIYAWDGSQYYDSTIIDSSDITNFETNYKSSCNKKINPIETGTGWLKVRPRKASGDIQLKYIYFTSATSNNFDDAGDSDYTISINEAHTKTIIDFMPDYDYELAGGRLRALSSSIANNTISLNFIMAPDIPEAYSGNYYIITNKHIDDDEKFFVMNEEPKCMLYDPLVPQASKVRLEINHSVDEQISFEYNLKIYRI